jgi:CheY-like chemotaxis protein
MSEFTSLLQALPALIWTVLGAALLWRFAPQLVELLPRIESFEGFGLKFALRALDDAVRARAAGATPAEVAGATDRLKREAGRLDGAEILWVDDRPSGNRREARIFAGLGAHITFAASSAEAEPLIAAGGFHLILSDMKRGDVEDEGLRLLRRLRAKGVQTPFLFYVGRMQEGLPEGAQGLTNRPDRLVALVLDVLAVRAASAG